jgi:hypothetical protein
MMSVRALSTSARRCDNSRVDDESRPPSSQPRPEDREIDYLMCSQCGTPCYVFEMEDGRIAEAMCLVCANDEVDLFTLGEETGADED